MELLLNLVWLVVAAASVGFWLSQKRRGASARAVTVALQSIALGCALAVLFPAISATDDLHAAQLAVEAQDVARKVLRNMNTVSSSGPVVWLHFVPALLLLAAMMAPRSGVLGRVSTVRAFLPTAEFFSFLESRPPPQFSA